MDALNDQTAETLQIPLLLYHKVLDTSVDVDFERTAIKSLRATRKIVTYQEFSSTYTGFVNDYRWVPAKLTYIDGVWTDEGTMIIEFKRVS